MFERTSGLPRKVLVAAALAVAAAFVLASFAPPWHLLELKGYDLLTRHTAPNASRFPITVVGIDEPSFAHIDKQWPWPRVLYARLVDQLAKSGALVVAFDVILDQASNSGPSDDAALAEAVKRAGNVVLASDRVFVETAVSRQWLRVNPRPEFLAAGAVNGFVNVEFDADQVMRNVPDLAVTPDAFWKRIVDRVETAAPGLIHVAPPPEGAMMRYAGPDHTFPYISFYQALDADKYLPADAFRDQVVLVGRDISADVDARSAQSDLFATPFTAATNALMPGVELHANFLEDAFAGSWIRPVPAPWSAALVLLVVALSTFVMRTFRPLLGAVWVLGLVAVLAGLDYALFRRWGLWLPVLAAMASAVTMYVACNGIAFVSERNRRAEIRRAFSFYVSEEVVEHVMAHPERLALGGERREVTMMFTDLAGFTPLTERLGPEQVTQILNLHFSRATAIVKKHRGTVNRFIGDAIMAMWGAPVDDPAQAANACLAAVEMQQDMEDLRAELARRGLPPIHMRVGLHSCSAVIGNLGSSDRFDYTAVGDGVNLAARLEGVNKLYSTGILLTRETADRAGTAVAFRPVDRVIVKGKSEPVEILTPCLDASLRDATERAVTAYRARLLDESERWWREVLARAPDDGVAEVYLERIRMLRDAPTAAWEDAVQLEKL
jgi:adenylate cyclase